MRIAILGGTGNLGRGLALRWAERHEIAIGSRFREKAEALVLQYLLVAKEDFDKDYEGKIWGAENREAAKKAEVAVLTVPGPHVLSLVSDLRGELGNKVVISPVVPLREQEGCFLWDPKVLGQNGHLSAAELVQARLRRSKVVSALQTISSGTLADLSSKPEADVLVSSDDRASAEIVSSLVEEIPNLRALYAGPLRVSRMTESVTPLLLNLSIYGGATDPSVKIAEF